MSQKEVYEFNVPTFGKGVVFDVGHEERAEQFRFFSEALKTARLQTYVQLMVAEAEAFFAERLKESGEVRTPLPQPVSPFICSRSCLLVQVDLRALLSDLIILTASRCLMGREVREHLFDRVADLFHDLDMGMQPISVVFPYLPIAAHRKRDSSRAELAKIFTKIIRARKDSGKSEPDVLQAFIDARYKDGRTLTEDQITGMLIAVLFAGQHTSSITSTWTGLFLMADKSWFKKCCDEQQAVRAKNGAELNYEVLAQMDTLHVCIKEALRLHPPLIMLMRLAHEDFSVTDKDGRTYTVPKGDIVATSPTFSHRLEHVWTDANTYNPARHQPGSTDGQKPFSFVGFGGGRHGCMGETFAYMQIKTIWSVLLRSYDFDIVSPFPEPDYDSMVVGPKPPCIVRYKRRAL
jgi:sterol 14-demethylase